MKTAKTGLCAKCHKTKPLTHYISEVGKGLLVCASCGTPSARLGTVPEKALRKPALAAAPRAGHTAKSQTRADSLISLSAEMLALLKRLNTAFYVDGTSKALKPVMAQTRPLIQRVEAFMPVLIDSVKSAEIDIRTFMGKVQSELKEIEEAESLADVEAID